MATGFYCRLEQMVDLRSGTSLLYKRINRWNPWAASTSISLEWTVWIANGWIGIVCWSSAVAMTMLWSAPKWRSIVAEAHSSWSTSKSISRTLPKFQVRFENSKHLKWDINESVYVMSLQGVALLDDHLCLSVSLDQRLILWKLEDTLMTWLCTVCCDVADIQGLDVWPAAASSTHTLVSVYGQGIQVFQLDRGTDINCEYALHRKTVAPLAH